MTNSAPPVVGSTVTALLRTELGKPHDVVPGLSPAYYYSVVLQLDFARHYELRHDGLHEWKEGERLFPLVLKDHRIDPTTKILGEKISSVAADDDGIVSVTFTSEVALSVTTEIGTHVHVEPSRSDGEKSGPTSPSIQPR